jgi:hypothetical protein
MENNTELKPTKNVNPQYGLHSSWPVTDEEINTSPDGADLNHHQFKSKIHDIKNAFYETSGKNLLFKKNQKFECADTISKSIGLDEMIKKTFYVLPNTNKVYADYSIFKLYATPDTFDYISTTLLDLLNTVSLSGSYELHINLDSFTISAYERYKQFITIYCNKCLSYESSQSISMSKMVIYNTPVFIDSISRILRPVMHPDVPNRITYYKKSESPLLLLQLLTTPP